MLTVPLEGHGVKRIFRTRTQATVQRSSNTDPPTRWLGCAQFLLRATVFGSRITATIFGFANHVKL